MGGRGVVGAGAEKVRSRDNPLWYHQEPPASLGLLKSSLQDEMVQLTLRTEDGLEWAFRGNTEGPPTPCRSSSG